MWNFILEVCHIIQDIITHTLYQIFILSIKSQPVPVFNVSYNNVVKQLTLLDGIIGIIIAFAFIYKKL